jgi:hypothetical protein
LEEALLGKAACACNMAMRFHFLLVILVGIVMVNEFIHCGFQWMEWYIGRLLKNNTFLFG